MNQDAPSRPAAMSTSAKRYSIVTSDWLDDAELQQEKQGTSDDRECTDEYL
jgi:hypothetical protein